MTASGFFPQCLASATEGVRLAARIVDTPCNEMNTDTFLEVRGPRESRQGGTRVAEALVEPTDVRGYPGQEGDSAAVSAPGPGTPGAAADGVLPSTQLRGAPGPRRRVEGGQSLLLKASLQDRSHDLQEIVVWRVNLLSWI